MTDAAAALDAGSLDEREAFAGIDAFTADEAARYRRLLAPIEARLSA